MMKRINEPLGNDQNISSSEGLAYLPERQKKKMGEKLTRNFALLGLMALIISAVHNAGLPDGQTILTAVQGAVDMEWNENLGKISFVSTIFPEAVSVFFDDTPNASLVAPCFGTLVHAWGQNEPYLGYQPQDGKVYAAGNGQVMSIAHGLNDEKILRICHDDGLETMYYNLASISVQEGDAVTANSLIGECVSEGQAIIEVRRDGKIIDPTSQMIPRIVSSL